MIKGFQSNVGLIAATTAYGIWGLLPLFFKLLSSVPAFELVGWRVVFTFPICLLFIVLRRQWGDLRAALADRALVLRLGMSAACAGTNWVIYVAAVDAGHVIAASFGYYIVPLINVLIGTVFLGERLARLQWIAVAIAVAGLALLAWGSLDMLWVAAAQALSFGLYGLVRKVTVVDAVPGLTIETAWLLLPALGVAAWFAASPAGSSMAAGARTALLLASTGVVTAVPLLLFTVGARLLDLSTLGFLQFLSPTIVFLLGHFAFGEPLDAARLTCFALIWIAIALFSWDMLHKARLNSHAKAPA